jgi:hypothetical protein
MLCSAPIAERAREGEENEIAPGTNVVGSPLSPISMATSRVSAVSEMAASAPR